VFVVVEESCRTDVVFVTYLTAVVVAIGLFVDSLQDRMPRLSVYLGSWTCSDADYVSADHCSVTVLLAATCSTDVAVVFLCVCVCVCVFKNLQF